MNTTDVDWAFEQYEAVRGALPTAEFPAVTERLTSIDAVVEQFDTVLLDAFGVLNIGDTAIPGAADFIAALRAKNRSVRIVSNSASVPTCVSLEKFARLGFDFSDAEITTSRDALKVGLARAPAMTWGVMAARNSEIEELGVPCHPLEDGDAAYDAADGFILLGSAEWTEARHARLVAAIRNRNRPVYVGNPDIVAPREDGLSREPGYFAHDLARRTGCALTFFGKPFANIYDLAVASLRPVDPMRTLMVGDTLHTDILGGAAYGFKTLLIRDYGLFAGREVEHFIERSGIAPNLCLSGYATRTPKAVRAT